MSSHPVPLARVVGAPAPLSWPESLALVLGLACAGTGREQPADGEAQDTLESFGVDENGSVVALSRSASHVSVSELALLLGRLIPARAAEPQSRAPAGLQFTIGRALGLVQAPEFQSLEQFCEALRRFERGDRRELLRGVFDRCQIERRVERRVTVPSADVLRRLLRESDRTAFEGNGRRQNAASAETLRRLLREADRQIFELQQGPAARPSWLRRGAAYGALAAAVMMAGAVGVLDRHRSPGTAERTTSLARPHASPAPGPSRRATDDRTAPGAGTPVPRTPVPGAGVSGTAGSDRPSSLVGEGASTAVSGTTGSGTPVPDTRASRTGGRLVEALDVGDRPVFSPSFAADSSAIFFDERNAGGSALMQARAGADGQMHVVSVVNDGAHNYHPHLSPDGQTLAFDSDRDGVRGVYLASRDGRNVRRVSGSGYAAVPTWSPDGGRLAFIKAEPDRPRVWNLWSLDVRSGDIERLTSYPFGQPWGASWFPDGRRICYAHEDELVVLDLATRRASHYRSPLPGTLVRTPAVSPDGRHVIFQLHGHGAWLLDLAHSSMREALDDPTAEEFAWSPDGRAVAFHSRRSGQWGLWFMMEP